MEFIDPTDVSHKACMKELFSCISSFAFKARLHTDAKIVEAGTLVTDAILDLPPVSHDSKEGASNTRTNPHFTCSHRHNIDKSNSCSGLYMVQGSRQNIVSKDDLPPSVETFHWLIKKLDTPPPPGFFCPLDQQLRYQLLCQGIQAARDHDISTVSKIVNYMQERPIGLLLVLFPYKPVTVSNLKRKRPWSKTHQEPMEEPHQTSSYIDGPSYRRLKNPEDSQ